jgi:radical SAM protein with 4Fe4S-binding SPASM domain
MPLSFDTPLRVTANLLSSTDGASGATAGRLGLPFPRLAAALTEAGVLEVALAAPPNLLAAYAGTVAALAGATALEVRLPAEAWPDAAQTGRGLAALAETWRAAGVSRLTVVLDLTALLRHPAAWAPRLDSLADLAGAWSGWAVAAAVAPAAATLTAALSLATAAGAAGLRRVAFLPPDLISPEAGGPRDLAWDAALLRGLSGGPPPGVDLVVHDYFLHRALFPAAQSPFPGCQAAGALAHLDAAGTLYPCPAVPLPLGSLAEESLSALWATPARQELRRRIETPGAACFTCPDQGSCRGGCRGLSFRASGRWDQPDPACPHPSEGARMVIHTRGATKAHQGA